jgi:long-subunit acyl-CoA synthetase (AMP-forming)/predicted GNAT family acetyltransferase
MQILSITDIVAATQAGSESLKDKDKKLLIKALEQKISALIEKNEKLQKQAIDNWNELLNSVNLTGLADYFCRKINPDIMYEFGKYLVDKLAQKSSGFEFLTHNYLNLFRRSAFLKRIYGDKKWEPLVLDLVHSSNFNMHRLFEQRLEEYANKVLFNELFGERIVAHSWREVNLKIKNYAYAFINNLVNGEDTNSDKVAFLMENSLTMAELDLACLTSGVVNVMIPANSVAQHVEYILNQTKAALILISDEKQLAKLKSVKNNLKYLTKAVMLQGSAKEDWVITLDEFTAETRDASAEILEKMQRNIRIDSLATIMYTSGTTGDPKGIMFSHLNLVSKRFFRAMAIPEIGDNDRFLAYLPLFHTFGRWFEMSGSVFWGAEYAFMENPALSTMLLNMQMVKPSIFISIPKKWYQLYEYISQKVNIEFDEEEEIKKAVQEATGGSLKFGLSAAGYLEPDVFRFFQKYGVELMSGFGMTEATGGISMTPPGKYRENTLGVPLPGIEMKLADDGELLIKGPYVSIGYYEGSDKPSGFDHGWLATGDIMTRDEKGYYKIIDRKKEIYKNIKGETIAPQKIENYFRDMEFIKQVFLVGDHRPFNTVLIYPDFENDSAKLKRMSEEEMDQYFSSVLVTINKFLASYERIIDYRTIERPFQEERGELTPKGTYKRRVIENNFDDIIYSMYKKNYISISWGSKEIRVPNWFVREKGFLTNHLKMTDDGLLITKHGRLLEMRCIDPENSIFEMGSYVYKVSGKQIDFNDFLANPHYWLGNEGVVNFTGDLIFQWYRLDEAGDRFHFMRLKSPAIISKEIHMALQALYESQEKSLSGLHLSALILQSSNFEQAMLGVNYLAYLLTDEKLPIRNLAVSILWKPGIVVNESVRKEVFLLGIPLLSEDKLQRFIERYLYEFDNLFDNNIIDQFIELRKGKDSLDAINDVIAANLSTLQQDGELNEKLISGLFNLLATYGVKHPTRYKRVRQMIATFQMASAYEPVKELASKARLKLLKGFRKWIGENQFVAVDVETGVEYQWQDVTIFEDEINETDRERILDIIKNTSLIRESIFLFSGGNVIRLYDIPPGGIWISRLEGTDESSAFRLSIQTRYQGGYDIQLNMFNKRATQKTLNEINWQILAGMEAGGVQLLVDFGGFWKSKNVYTQEFNSGYSVAKVLQRSLRKKGDEATRMQHVWPFFIWTAMATHITFWHRTGNKMIVKNMEPGNIVIPAHDYQTGQRLISISGRKNEEDIGNIFNYFYKRFIVPVEMKYPQLKRDDICYYMVSGIIDALGVDESILKINQMLSGASLKNKVLKEKISTYIAQIEERGYTPKYLYFAIRRFHRWYELNSGADLSAQARTLNELYDTYNLQELEKTYPETRTRFFLETVFADSAEAIKNTLFELLNKQRLQKISHDESVMHISIIQKEFEINEKEQFFLTRLSYPHLKPTDFAELISAQGEGDTMADVVVQLEDYDGEAYFVRRPVSPKEISKLHQLFLDSSLPVKFKPEHRFLIAIAQRGHVIGGLFYSILNDATVYMEKIVVSQRYRKKGISEGVMNEFLNRMRGKRIHYVTTGFFRPEYFYRFGFKIERKYAGLVKDLQGEENA